MYKVVIHDIVHIARVRQYNKSRKARLLHWSCLCVCLSLSVCVSAAIFHAIIKLHGYIMT